MSATRTPALDLTACPICGSGRIACVVGLKVERLDFCMRCLRMWEPMPPGEPYTRDGEMLPFKVPCDNCAFRGGSSERADKDGWNELQIRLAYGDKFYCHKGVPFNVINEQGEPATAPGDRDFIFPKKPLVLELQGKECHSQTYDTDRMRVCRGYLNAHVLPQLKEFACPKK